MGGIGLNEWCHGRLTAINPHPTSSADFKASACVSKCYLQCATYAGIMVREGMAQHSNSSQGCGREWC